MEFYGQLKKAQKTFMEQPLPRAKFPGQISRLLFCWSIETLFFTQCTGRKTPMFLDLLLFDSIFLVSWSPVWYLCCFHLTEFSIHFCQLMGFLSDTAVFSCAEVTAEYKCLHGEKHRLLGLRPIEQFAVWHALWHYLHQDNQPDLSGTHASPSRHEIQWLEWLC